MSFEDLSLESLKGSGLDSNGHSGFESRLEVELDVRGDELADLSKVVGQSFFVADREHFGDAPAVERLQALLLGGVEKHVSREEGDVGDPQSSARRIRFFLSLREVMPDPADTEFSGEGFFLSREGMDDPPVGLGFIPQGGMIEQVFRERIRFFAEDGHVRPRQVEE